MTLPKPIHKILRRVLTLSLPPLAAACGGIDTEGFQAVACGSDGSTPYLSNIKPSDPADYAELRVVQDPLGGGTKLIGSFGEKCAAATDKAACEEKIKSATSEKGFFLGECVDVCVSHILVVNHGDDVTVVDTAAGVKAWLGAVDSPADAVLTASVEQYTVRCNDLERGGTRKTGDAYEVLGTRITSACDPIDTHLFVLSVSASGDVKEVDSEVISHEAGACIGRRPAGLLTSGGRGNTRVGAYFANIAHLEAASVHAFDAIERELIHHGAPAELIEQARAARLDEVRHARVMRRVAARYGGRSQEPRVEPRPIRSIEAMAIDNATEGCVRETFGALVGMWQARFAQDPAVRRVMRRIARDETRHASLSWAIDAWIRTRLSDDALARMEEARLRALAEVEADEGEHDDAIVRYAGVPGRNDAKRLSRHFVDAITHERQTAAS